MLRYIKNNFGPFFTGVFFTIFMILFVFVIFLYNENANLRNKIDKLTDLDIQITTGDSKDSQLNKSDTIEAIKDSKGYEDVPTSTYLLPKEVEIKPSNKPNKDPEGSSTYKPYYKATDVEFIESRNLERGDKKITEIAGYTYDDKGEVVTATAVKNATVAGTGRSSNAETYTVHKDVVVEPGEFIEKQSITDTVYSNKRNLGIDKAPASKKVYSYNPLKWKDLSKNMTKFQIKKILGEPSEIVIAKEFETFVYKYNSGVGKVFFDSSKLVDRWETPE